jgi:hypothetical protein
MARPAAIKANPAMATGRLREPVRGNAPGELAGLAEVVRPATWVWGEVGVGFAAVRAGRSLAEAAWALDAGAGAAGGGAVGDPEGRGVASCGGALGAGCAGDGAGEDGAGEDGAGFAGGGPGFAGGEPGEGWSGGLSAPEGGRPEPPPVSGQWQPGRSTHRGGAFPSGAGGGSGRSSCPGHRPQGRRQSAGS